MSTYALNAVFQADPKALGLDVYQMAVLTALADCAWDDGTNAFPAVGTIAERWNISERKVQGCLQDLITARLILPTRLSTGGRRTTVYAVNLERLRRHPRVAARAKTGVPDFGDEAAAPVEAGADAADNTPHAVRGIADEYPARRAQYPAQRAQYPAQRAPYPSEPSRTPARQGARDPDGRAPGLRKGGGGERRDGGCEADAAARLDAAGRGRMATAGLAAADRTRAFDVWAALVAALVAKREAEAVRHWVDGPGVSEVHPGHLAVVVARGAVGRRAREELEPILQRHGWRVVEAGTAWGTQAA